MTTVKRRIFITLVVLLVLAGTGWLALPLVVEPIVRHKLQAAAAGHLGADLHIGVLDYTFPYGVRARNVRLYSIADQAEIFTASEIDFALAKLPLGSGPLQIERVAIDRPMVRIVRRKPAAQPTTQRELSSTDTRPTTQPEPSGTDTQRQLSSADATPTTQRQPSSAAAQPTTQRGGVFQPTMKLSDVFRLRMLLIRDGSIQYEDRRHAGSMPLTWRHLNTEIRLTPKTGSRYGWGLTADSGAVADLASSGTIDIDQLVLDVEELGINAHAGDAGSAATLPDQVQQLLKRFEAQGDARLQGSAHFPLREPDSATVQADVRLTGARATVRGVAVTGDVQLAAQKLVDDPKLAISITKCVAQFEQGSVELSRGGAVVDVRTGKTAVNELVAAVKGVSFTPRGFNQPIEQITGTVHFSDGQAWSEDLSAQCGGDRIVVKSVRAGRSPSSEVGAIELRDILAAIDFHRPREAAYPGVVGKVIDALGPSGAYTVRGRFTPRHGETRADYDLMITTRGGAMAVGKRRLDVTNIRGEAEVIPQRVIIRRVLANACDGALAGAGTVGLDSKPFRYAGELSLEQADVQQLADVYLRPSATQPAPRLSGRCDGSFSARGQGTGLDGFGGKGELRITEGQLWEMPVLKAVASRVKLAREALTASEAAAMFEIADRNVMLTKAALNSPALGLTGTGTISMDGNLDLDVLAAPFGDWERQLRKTNVPLVSDLAGSFAGGVQCFVSAAAGQLLFEFRVNGTIGEPKVETVPAPILTEPVANVLGKMVRREGNLLEMLRGEKKKPE